MKNLPFKLYIITLIVILLFIIPFLFEIRLFIILELYKGLPIILSIALMSYCSIDLLTPNPKHSTLYGFLYSEFLEHIILPLTLVITLLFVPFVFLIVYIFLIFYFYGYILGESKAFRDVIKLVTLLFLLITFSFYPDFVLFFNAMTNCGLYLIIASLIFTALSYFVFKSLKIKQHCFDVFGDFVKGYAILILTTIVIMIIIEIT